MKGKTSNVVLLTGGNLGDREENINKAQNWIEECIGRVEKASSIVESTPWGFESENKFLNQVLEVNTALEPMELLRQCQALEDRFKRVRNPEHYISRTMDIDILFIENVILNTQDLTIPHPHLHKRRFTLLPLDQILPDFIHPCLKKTVKELLSECEDYAEVHIFEGSKKS